MTFLLLSKKVLLILDLFSFTEIQSTICRILGLSTQEGYVSANHLNREIAEIPVFKGK